MNIHCIRFWNFKIFCQVNVLFIFCRSTQFPNKHLRNLLFLNEHFRDISVLSDKASAVDNQRSEAVGGQAYVALSLTYYYFDLVCKQPCSEIVMWKFLLNPKK